MSARKPKTEEPTEPEFDPKVVARQITKIEEALTRIERGGLNRRAIIALIQDHTKLGKRTIIEVLNSLTTLRARYVHFPKRKAARK